MKDTTSRKDLTSPLTSNLTFNQTTLWNKILIFCYCKVGYGNSLQMKSTFLLTKRHSRFRRVFSNLSSNRSHQIFWRGSRSWPCLYLLRYSEISLFWTVWWISWASCLNSCTRQCSAAVQWSRSSTWLLLSSSSSPVTPKSRSPSIPSSGKPTRER